MAVLDADQERAREMTERAEGRTFEILEMAGAVIDARRAVERIRDKAPGSP